MGVIELVWVATEALSYGEGRGWTLYITAVVDTNDNGVLLVQEHPLLLRCWKQVPLPRGRKSFVFTTGAD